MILDVVKKKSWIRPGPLALTLTLSTSCILTAAGPLPAERLLQMSRPLVIAHRGYSAFAPENTLPAFQLAKAAGADLVELDYHIARDRVPIVIHDSDLDRTTDAAAKWGGKKIGVNSRSAAELQTLDAGKWLDPKFTGTRLLRLNEALDIIQTNGGVTLIERKAGDAASCVQLLRERNEMNHVVVQSFDWAFLKDFHDQMPQQILGALGPAGTRNGKKLTDEEKTLNPEWIDEAKKAGASVVGWNKLVTRESVAYAHGQKLKVWVYTIDDPAEAAALLDLGVDGIITNNPSLVWRAMALRGVEKAAPANR
ncbi:MAG TPA: glycerophosphodiester phosphodiesterase family protein [Candidatus Paceibacterota bacterium]|nr:glycerophosphodiester phosphodiesterase family protein [Verrucomicrobiota bacterium]HRY50384.1 glycerophosphodiester phosphodiesterase family protein [Candidatus Paceibacterota bacterium]HSA03148.1 glycerophosphodiester phosphodiesterase family protein [Candidatus Paceibacterota bacterium]